MDKLEWRKSTKSGPNCDNCVEVAYDGTNYHVRNSRTPNGGTLTFDQGEWDAFVAGVAAGEF